MADPRSSLDPVEPDLSVVLPTYNEAGHIVELVTLIAQTLETSRLSYEIIVIDDDSPDGTCDVVSARFHDDARVRSVRRTDERGLASAIGHGISLSRGTSITVLDTDFNHDPRLIPAMLEMLRSSDLVIGSRYVRGGGMPDPRRYWASYLFNLVVRALVATGVHDNLSGYFIARRAWLQSLAPETVFNGYGDYFMRLIFAAKRGALRIVETPVVYGLRPTGLSKTSFLHTPFRYLAAALRLGLGIDRPHVRVPVSTPVAQ